MWWKSWGNFPITNEIKKCLEIKAMIESNKSGKDLQTDAPIQ